MQRLLLGAACALACAGALAQSTSPPEQAGTMKIVTGDVRAAGADLQERKLQPGDRIAASERLVTGQSGAASVVLRDGTVMALGPGSQLDLRRFTYDSTTQEGSIAVSLLRGSMRMISGLISKTNRDAVSVTARTTTIGIRGTDFIVSLDEEQP